MAIFFPAAGDQAGTFDIVKYGAELGHDVAPAINAAIAAAENQSSGDFSAIYVPSGDWTINSPVTWNKALCIYGEGPSSRLIAGASMATQFMFNGQSHSAGPAIFRGLSLINTVVQSTSSPQGGCIKQITALPFLTLEDCFFQSSGDCVYGLNIFVLNAKGCKFLSAPDGSGLPTAGRGIVSTVSGGSTDTCDFQGLNVALGLAGVGHHVKGCRMEANDTVIRLGLGPDGIVYGFTGGVFEALELEANGVAVDLTNGGTECRFACFTITGEQQGPLGGVNSRYGVIQTGRNVYELVNPSGDFTRAAFQINSGPALFISCTASNNIGPVWDQRAPWSDVRFIGQGPNSRSNGSDLPIDFAGTKTRAIGKFDNLNTMVQGVNLSGTIAVASAGAPTSIDVKFPVAHNGGEAEVSSIVEGTGGSLVPGTTYYYFGTIVSETGETGGSITLEHSHTMGVGKTSNTVTVFGNADDANIRRRIYRGTASGVYGGYYEGALGQTTFTDTGAAFTGFGNPPATGTTTSGPEPDANYKVDVTPGWNAGGVWVVPSEKLTTGFKVRWATAPGADSSLDWLIYR